MAENRKIFVLGGYGGMGRIASIDLAETFRGDIVIAGRDAAKAARTARSFRSSRIAAAEADASSPGELSEAISGADVVLNAAQYNTNVDVMKAALRAGAHYVDLGGLFHVTKKQLRLHGKFRRRGLTAILGCGATPGIMNVLAAWGAQKFSRIDSIHVQFADKDWTRHETPFVVPYSMRTVFDEFMMKPAVFAGGRTRFVEPMSGGTDIAFPPPVGSAYCFYTLHSEVATFPSSFRSKGIRDCSFRGGFDRDFSAKVRFLIDAGLADTKPVKIGSSATVPRDFTVSMLNRFIPGSETKIRDLEYLRVEITGKAKGRRRLTAYCKSLANRKHNIPAGSWNTGVPPSIAAQMLAAGGLAHGALPPELCIPPEKFFAELRKRNITVFAR